jgi:hypothetical protein
MTLKRWEKHKYYGIQKNTSTLLDISEEVESESREHQVYVNNKFSKGSAKHKDSK